MKMQDLKSWCRLCASDGIHKVDIFLIHIENNSSIADDLNKLCNLKLENQTELPTKICEQCIISIKNIKEFLLNSIQTQKLLADLLSNKINNCTQLRKKYKITVDPGIKEDDLSCALKIEHDLRGTCFSENELIEENEIKNEISSKSFANKNCSNIFEDENSFVQFIENSDEIFYHSEGGKKDILGDLSSRNIKGKVNKKRKTNNLKKEKLLLENDKSTEKEISKTSKLFKDKVLKSKKQSEEFQCKVCKKIFSSQGGLTTHMKIRHSINKDPHTCKFCGKKFEKRQALENHENTHLPSEERKQLLCPHCDKKFTSESGRWTHIHSVHDKKKAVICEECGKEFSTKHHLARHKISHTEEKKFQCPYCPAKLKAKGGLTTHMHTHGESHPCLECGLMLKTKQLLKNHMVVHSDVKNFKCNFCNKDFKRLNDLNYHLITHIGIKPFECRICNQKFVHNMTYRRHLKATHAKEFSEMVAKGERISNRNFPPLEQLKAINEAAKSEKQFYDLEKTDENIVDKSEVRF